MSGYALIAEPDAARAAVYAAILKEEGLPTLIVKDGVAASAALTERGAPALAVVDLSLPQIDGFEIIERIRRAAPSSTAAVLAVSEQRELRDAAVDRRKRLGIGAILANAASTDSIRRVVKLLLLPEGTGAAAAPGAVKVEQRRVAAAGESAGLAGDATDEPLHAIVSKVARDFNVPIAILTLALDDNQLFKAVTGLDERDASRLLAFARDTVDAREPLNVPDAKVHPSLAGHALVRGGLVRGYASVPVLTPAGDRWGTLAIVSSKKPLLLASDAMNRLWGHAKAVTAELELRTPSGPDARKSRIEAAPRSRRSPPRLRA